MIQTYRRRLGLVVLAALSLAVAVWLGYAFGRGQSLTDLAHLYRDQTIMDYTVDTGGLVALYARTGGDLKPLIKLPDGTPIVDYSDWDYNAVVIADGERYEFVRLIPTSSVDYARNRLVQGLSNADWELSREVTLQGSEARVAFSFLAKRHVHDVHITVAHDDWYWSQVTPAPDGFTATVPHATRDEIESGLVRKPAYEMSLKVSSPRPLPPDLVRVDLATSFGVQSVSTRYQLTDPPVGLPVPIATERITWRRL